MYGYKAQCELLSEHLELLIAGCEARTQSLICEGALACNQAAACTSHLSCTQLHSLLPTGTPACTINTWFVRLAGAEDWTLPKFLC